MGFQISISNVPLPLNKAVDKISIPYSQKYWQLLNLAVLAPNCVLSISAMVHVRKVSTYIHARGIKFGNFNLAVERHTTKPPNFPAIR